MERINDLAKFTQEQDPESLLFSLPDMTVPGTKDIVVSMERNRY